MKKYLMELLFVILRIFKRTFWWFVYRIISVVMGSDMKHYSLMNYGYAPLSLENCSTSEKYRVQLYCEIFRRAIMAMQGSIRDIKHLRVLEIGCGRVGGLQYLRRNYENFFPGKNISVDWFAIDLVTPHASAREGINFTEADSCNLPYDEETFDLVINVESSHCYEDIEKFFSEVYRVCKKSGGVFAYTDFVPADGLSLRRQQLSVLFNLEHSDITANVVDSLAMDSEDNKAVIAELVPRPLQLFGVTHALLCEMAGVKDSVVETNLRLRKSIYFLDIAHPKK